MSNRSFVRLKIFYIYIYKIIKLKKEKEKKRNSCDKYVDKLITPKYII